MGVPNRPADDKFFAEAGWRHVVVASSGRYELRVFPDRQPGQAAICVRTARLKAEAVLRPSYAGWVMYGTEVELPAHEPFPDPVAAFQWWLNESSPARNPEASDGA